jgi:hypothetical protein
VERIKNWYQNQQNQFKKQGTDVNDEMFGEIQWQTAQKWRFSMATLYEVQVKHNGIVSVGNRATNPKKEPFQKTLLVTLLVFDKGDARRLQTCHMDWNERDINVPSICTIIWRST